LLQAAREGGRLGPGVFDGGGRRQARDASPRKAAAACLLQRLVDTGRDPHIGIGYERRSEARRHDANDFIAEAVELDGAPEHVRIGAQRRAPQTVAHQDDEGSVGPVFFGGEGPPEGGIDPKHVGEHLPRDHRSLHSPGLAVENQSR